MLLTMVTYRPRLVETLGVFSSTIIEAGKCSLMCSLASRVFCPGVVYVTVVCISLTEANCMSVSNFRSGREVQSCYESRKRNARNT